jgi:HK97 family phage prohead protease
MPYGISDKQGDCSGWATVKEESDGSYTTMACHDTKQEAIDQMVAISISEDMQPLGEVNSRSQMSKKIERRTFTVRDIETRQAEDGTMRLSGYAAVFNDNSVPLPFVERIAPGAFRKTLTETPDVRLLINHEGLPLARTKNGTLTLSEDERGLYMDAVIADTQEGRDLYTLVQRGDLDQMSFAFRVIRQKWNEARTERLLTELSLADGDVSVVTYPAYPTTSVEARQKIAEAMAALKEGRALDGESLMVVQAILDKVAEASEYLEEGKSMIEELIGLNVAPEAIDEEMPEEMPMDASRKISLRLAKAIINNTK